MAPVSRGDTATGTIGSLLADRADAVPTRAALIEIVDGQRRAWTYHGLFAAATAVAAQLGGQHKRGAHVAIWAPNSAEWVLGCLGASLAGLVVIPVNPAFTESEVSYILSQSKARGLLYAEEHFGASRVEAAQQLAAKHGVAITPVSRVGVWADQPAAPSSTIREVSEHDPAMVLYSSGTTGAPKGALLRHNGLIIAARQMMNRLGFDDAHPPVWLNTMPFFHVGGCGTAMLGSIACGGTQVLLPRFEPVAVLDAITEESVSGMLAVPTMMSGLLEAHAKRTETPDTLVSVLTGAANVPGDIVENFSRTFNCNVAVSYGQTEAHGALTATMMGDSGEQLLQTVGIGFDGVELQVRDLRSGDPVPAGTAGEVCFRGPQMMNGYFEMPEATAEAFTSDGWLRTGDVGILRPDGYLSLTGRLKEMLIRGGENVFPLEIENVLESVLHRDVAVVPVPDRRWGEEVGAVLESRGQTELDELVSAALVGCTSTLAPYKVPRYWYLLDELPRTASGKVRKVDLAHWIADGSLSPDFVTKSVRDRSFGRAGASPGPGREPRRPTTTPRPTTAG